MHLLLAQKGVISEADEAIDLGQTPGDIVFLSSADTEIASLSVAKASLGSIKSSLRLANLMALSHPMSVDYYLARTASHARLIVIRVIGGESYWSYGLQTFFAYAVEHNIQLIVLPGDDKPDESLKPYSTVNHSHCEALWSYLIEGGADNIQNFLHYCDFLLGRDSRPSTALPLMKAGLWWPQQQKITLDDLVLEHQKTQKPVIGLCFYRALVQSGQTKAIEAFMKHLQSRGAIVLPIFVASLKDPLSVAIIDQIFDRISPDIVLNGTGFAVSNGQMNRQKSVLEKRDAMVLQIIFSGNTREVWENDDKGLSARDLAMNVALPEIDGRVLTRAVSFKSADYFDEETQCNVVIHEPDDDRIEFVSDLTMNWVNLRRKKISNRKVAIVMANYPGGDGRLGHGVGLDTPASTMATLHAMKLHGYTIENIPDTSNQLMDILSAGPTNEGVENRIIRETISLKDYKYLFQKLDKKIQDEVLQHWGKPETDAYIVDQAFALPVLMLGETVVSIQPERAYGMDAKSVYHAPDIVPSHHYLAFYFWLRFIYKADAIVHMGKHGNLEWLPGKALALSRYCYPEIALGSIPHIYPFIVNDPGEGTQAKRRSSAVIIDHLTPPLTRAESYGPLKDLEVLVDEYYEASGIDPRRLKKLKSEILDLVVATGLNVDAGIDTGDNDDLALEKLDAFLCDLKELQIRDGLHILGHAPTGEQLENLLVALVRVPRGECEKDSLHRAIAKDLELDFDPLDCDLNGVWTGNKPEILYHLDSALWRSNGDSVERIEILALGLVSGTITLPEGFLRTKAVLADIENNLRPMILACGDNEIQAILKALDGCFVAPGPSGAPTRGRADVLPTGRNFFSVDTRSVPTPSAWTLGKRSAELLIKQFVQDHGDWPKAFGLTAWGTANMRTGGDDIAQALALIGVKPLWDTASRRVTGYEIIPVSVLGRPRVDVTLRISGFFRDAFPDQMRLFDLAVRAVAQLDEDEVDNPIAQNYKNDCHNLQREGYSIEVSQKKAGYRIFGARPGVYGTGVQELLDKGSWKNQKDLGRAWRAHSSFAYGLSEPSQAEDMIDKRLNDLNAVVQNQDNREHDVLDSGEYYAFEGGMASAIHEKKGQWPTIYHNDMSRPERPLIKTLQEEIARTLHARAVNPKWIKSAMRHGFKGGVEMVATVDYLFAFAATTNAVSNHHFEMIYDAYIGDREICNFLKENNPAALIEMANKLAESIDRNLWTPRSNSAHYQLEELQKGFRQ
ncbi:cobaltochelatase subunit CobN [Bartonella tamiae]|uniref:Cobaltochelatase subunit CobN n=1 Tax=Bartonella tamiae Th239 TaxID=1094558 RepID=J0QSW5_9HYPH|nr:cobaltochelatase subunit CobN [Bartonella tamiae]EJF88931.1 cobaltochelatase, CobN subunit [Bartonella tamiae Th239]EJF94819.1 cobaltochelatase, CobN subunit [Bartonella tamiae Th307]